MEVVLLNVFDIFSAVLPDFPFSPLGFYWHRNVMEKQSLTWSWFSELEFATVSAKKTLFNKTSVALDYSDLHFKQEVFWKLGDKCVAAKQENKSIFFSLLKLVVALLVYRSFWTEAQTYQCIEGSDGGVLLIVSELNAFVGTKSSFKSPENATTSF